MDEGDLYLAPAISPVPTNDPPSRAPSSATASASSFFIPSVTSSPQPSITATSTTKEPQPSTTATSTPQEPQPSTSGIKSKTLATLTIPNPVEKYLHYPAKILYKKRKAPATPLPSVISARQYRSQLLEKAKGQKDDDWLCVYCNHSWSNDKESKVMARWIDCDHCDKKMHISCLPKKHMNEICFDWDAMKNGEDVDFMCECCLEGCK